MAVNDLRKQIELRLRGELLRDWCRQLAAQDESVVFDDAWCSGQGCIRFCTRAIDLLVDSWRGAGDAWGLGRLSFYEIVNDPDEAWLQLSVSSRGMPKKTRQRINQLMDSIGKLDSRQSVHNGVLVVASWKIGDESSSANDVVAMLEDTWNDDVTAFEKQLIVVEPDSLLVEGAELAVISNRFERNREARERCIAAHGATCAVCGFDSGLVYGAELEGIIDVHHKVPLNQIRSDYVVDPVRDLVPLCPNCHRAIHSKSGGGVYSMDELRQMFRGTGRR